MVLRRYLDAECNVQWLTKLHRPQNEHTEIEEELHERAHIDYDRVSIVRTSQY